MDARNPPLKLGRNKRSLAGLPYYPHLCLSYRFRMCPCERPVFQRRSTITKGKYEHANNHIPEKGPAPLFSYGFSRRQQTPSCSLWDWATETTYRAELS